MTDKLARAKLARAAERLNAQSGFALPPLVLMTDDARLADPLATVHALPRGSMVILRERKDARRMELAKQLRDVTHKRGIKLLIANDAELALRTGADGVHLAQAHAHQASYWRARRPNWFITAAAHTLSATHVACADALIVAPVFPTKSHPDGKFLGAIRLRLIARQAAAPVYALGGIDANTVKQLEGVKLAGLAAVGALAV